MSYRKQILSELIDKGNYTASSLFGHEASLAEDWGYAFDKMECVPEENQKLILDNIDTLINDTAGKGSFSEVMSKAAKRGYLSFKPYIKVYDYYSPDLVLKYNRYLHMFRGYHYQVSYTATGIGEYSSASIRTDYLLQVFGKYRESKLLKMLFYMNCINACYGIDAFSKLLQESPEVLDEFMQLSTQRTFSEFDVTYQDLCNLVTEATVFLEEPEAIYRIPKSATMDFCRLYVYNRMKLRVEFMKGGDYHNLIFVLPDWHDGLSEELLNSDDPYDVDELRQFNKIIYEDDRVFSQFICFALNYSGVVINYMAAYSQELNEPIKALNNPNVKVVNSLNDFE